MQPDADCIIVGGGAAGFFAALTAAEQAPSRRIVILEQSPRVLAKVAISGGGRCNVTHECYDPAELVKAYPRGSRELLGPFHKWQPADTMAWFEERGVALKVEADGRVFPVSDSSQSIIDCLTDAAAQSGIEVITRTGVADALALSSGGFILTLQDESTLRCRCLMLATGGNRNSRGHSIARSLGHSVQPPVPSLFTFVIQDQRLNGLAGISVPHATVSVPKLGLEEQGPVLVTHWGLSGPGILRLSAWGARPLADVRYTFELEVNWCGKDNIAVLQRAIDTARKGHPRRKVANTPLCKLPARLWERLVADSGLPEQASWISLNRQQVQQLTRALTHSTFSVTGRSNNKDEFVTCGGITLTEIDFKNVSSRLQPGLFFGGEILDIDAITGGYNFQAAWTTGHLAGRGIADTLSR